MCVLLNEQFFGFVYCSMFSKDTKSINTNTLVGPFLDEGAVVLDYALECVYIVFIPIVSHWLLWISAELHADLNFEASYAIVPIIPPSGGYAKEIQCALTGFSNLRSQALIQLSSLFGLISLDFYTCIPMHLFSGPGNFFVISCIGSRVRLTKWQPMSEKLTVCYNGVQRQWLSCSTCTPVS